MPVKTSQCAFEFVRRNWQVVPCIALGLAGVGKLVSMQLFESSLATWTIMPPYLRTVIMHLIPGIELGIGVASLIRPFRLAAVLVAVVLLFAYSAAWIIQYWVGGPPTCACFGLQLAWTEGRHESIVVLSRNSLLILWCVAALIGGQSRGVQSSCNVAR